MAVYAGKSSLQCEQAGERMNLRQTGKSAVRRFLIREKSADPRLKVTPPSPSGRCFENKDQIKTLGIRISYRKRESLRKNSRLRIQRNHMRLLIFMYQRMALPVLLLLCLPPLFAQVNPAEIKDPRLREAEQTYLPRLIDLNHTISEMHFPFSFSLNRHVGLDPKDQTGADTRGLEFVNFNEREVLKFTGNYNAAFNANILTPNQRAGRVLNDVILPMIRLLPDYFNAQDRFDSFGFEIGYHVLKHKSSYEYEGKEILVVVLDKPDGLRFGAFREPAQQQEILNRSEVYLNGEPFGLALNREMPFDIDALARHPTEKRVSVEGQMILPEAHQNNIPMPDGKADAQAPGSHRPEKQVAEMQSAQLHAGKTDPDALQKKYQSLLEALKEEGVAKYHFVDYAPPSFVLIRDQAALQATLRSTEMFDKNATSIYRRAARTFDLFLAPQLKGILGNIPEDADFNVLDFTIILDLTDSNSAKSSEAIEFILPLALARRFALADVTNQDLINDSTVLVNGIRISLNLAQVE
jgi:hypothetical protein